MNAFASPPALRELMAVIDRGVLSAGDAEAFIRAALRCFGGSALVVAENHDFSGWNRHHGLPDAWVTSYPEMRAFDNSIAILDRAPLGTPFFVGRDSTPAHKALPIYQLLLTLGFCDSAIVRVPGPRGRELTLAVYRERGAKPFGEHDETLFRLLYPHLCKALGARSALLAFDGQGLRDREEILESQHCHAVLSLDRGEVSWSKPSRTLCREKLGALGKSAWQGLERALLRLGREYRARPQRAFERPFLPGLRVEFAQLGPTRLLALFFDERADSLAGSDAARHAAEELLTPMERRVARVASEGLSVRQIARTLRVGEETVRTHLKHVYQKLGVRSRAELGRAFGT